MPTPEDSPPTGFRLSLRGGPMVPLVGACVGVVALTAAVTLGGEDSSSNTESSNTGKSGVLATAEAGTPSPLPAANSCVLMVERTARPLTVPAARTLTQIAAVGWQVKAPEDMVARVLDLAAAKSAPAVTVTDALDMFTREDSAAPSAAAVADLRALNQPGGLSCVFGPPAVPAEAKGKSGLTPRADAMRQGVVDAFGKLAMSGYGAKAKATNSAAAAGRALDVAIPETAPTQPGAAWVLAHWLTARAADYKLDTIAFADRVWAPKSGWQTTAPGQPQATPARPGRVYVSVTPGTSASKATKAKDAKKTKAERRKAARKNS